jgi:formylglycine-generating enzyme required for sulfatase activity
LHKYDLYDGGDKIDTISTNITKALNFLRSAIDPNYWQNSKKIGFLWVPGLPGGGLWTGAGSIPRSAPGGLVSQYEITQGQYKLMSGNNPSTFTSGGDKYPVENVTWDEAVAFCKWLNQNDTAKPQGWDYTLPSDQQYVFFAADADSLPRVSSEGLDRANRPTHPAEVGSTHKPNRFRLHDVVGNVAEWVLDHDPAKKDRFYRGGSYLNFTARTVASSAREGNREKDSNIGFRIILIPR